jgi:hypothetical protein
VQSATAVTLSVMSSALALGLTGIVVSGVVGPAIAAWFSRRGDEQRFARDQTRRRDDDLRSVLDESAELLGAGGTNLRLAYEAVVRGESIPGEVDDWAGRVHLLGQRLLLRLPPKDPIVTSYGQVREALLEVGRRYGDAAEYDKALSAFEARRTAYVESARRALAEKTT